MKLLLLTIVAILIATVIIVLFNRHDKQQDSLVCLDSAVVCTLGEPTIIK